MRDYVLPDYTHIKRGHVRMPGESSSGTEQVHFLALTAVTDLFLFHFCTHQSGDSRPSNLCHLLCLFISSYTWPKIHLRGRHMSRHSRPILQRIGMQSLVRYGADVTLLSTVAT